MNQVSAYTLWSALNATRMNVVIADARQDGLPLVYVNQAFEDTTGHTAEDVLGRNCRFLQGPDTDPDTIALMREALADARPFEVEILNYRADGKPFWNLLNVTPVFGPGGELESFVGCQTDITEKKQRLARDAQLARTQSLGILAGGLAHEMNNLLQPMITYPEFIRDLLPNDAEDALTGLSFIETHAQAAKSIVGQVLRFARAEAVDLKAVDLPTEIRSLLDQVTPTLPSTIQLDLKIEATPPDMLKAEVDVAGLRTLLSNTVQNAVDAIGDRPGAITVEILGGNDSVHIAISDDGCGISGDHLNCIFDPFFTTKPVGKGTGLGLALIAADVQRWGGTIIASSAIGRGTRFDVSLPRVSTHEHPNEVTSDAA